MRVGYIGNFTRPWCTEVHVAGSLQSLGHEVVQLQEDVVDWPGLCERVLTAGCDMLLWTRTWGAPEQATAMLQLDRLRDAGVRSVAFHLDRWWGLDREYQLREDPFFLGVDLVVTADGGHDAEWAELGVEHVWSPPGVYGPDCALQGRRRRRPGRVAFVGSHPYPHPRWRPYRDQLISFLRSRYRSRFELWPRMGPVRGQSLTDLYQSVDVVVGDSCLVPDADGQPVSRYWSDRVPETLGRGGLLVHPAVAGLDELYPDLPTYPLGDFDELGRVIDWWCENHAERNRRRDNLRQLVRGRDTYQHRMRDLIDLLDERWQVTACRHSGVDRERLFGWTGEFSPRDVDVAGTDFVVVVESWRRNDYRVTEDGFTGTVLDVGANVGAFTVLAAKAGAGHVVAVEPEPDNRARLEEHVKLNRVDDRVTILPCAVVPGGGEGEYRRMRGVGGGAVAELATAPVPAEDVRPVVQTVSVATLVRDYGPFEMVKMDIEGGEWLLLEDWPLLLDNAKRLSMEWHGPSPNLPHLHLVDVPRVWGWLVAVMADKGTVETCGHPNVGGLLHWRSYDS